MDPSSSTSSSMSVSTSNPEYLLEGNEVVEMKLIRTEDDLLSESNVFKPEMCHQIFGKRELVYGYKELKIKIYYSAARVRIYCGIEYREKLDDVEPVDLLRKISEKYEIPLIENVDVFRQHIYDDKGFLPYGEHITTFKASAETGYVEPASTFEIYFSTNATPGFSDYHQRAQTFMLWFIDAATYVNMDDSAWKFFTIYEKYKTHDRNTAYAFVGFATVYEFYAYPDKIRPRISQVLILPPFQHRGICARLLNTIYLYYSPNLSIKDFAVEDPTDEFQRVRDYVDCLRVLHSGSYDPNAVCIQGRKEFIDDLLRRFRINLKQGRRVYEILRLKNCHSVSGGESFDEYRKEIKKRLNLPFQRQNRASQRCLRVGCGHLWSEQGINEHFISEEERRNRVEQLFSDLMDQYTLVLNRLESDVPVDFFVL